MAEMNPNRKKYAVIDEFGKVLGKFRTKFCANTYRVRLKLNPQEKLSVIPLTG